MPISLQGFTDFPWHKEFSPIMFMSRADMFRVFPKALRVSDVESKNQIGCHILSLLSLLWIATSYDLHRREMQHRGWPESLMQRLFKRFFTQHDGNLMLLQVVYTNYCDETSTVRSISVFRPSPPATAQPYCERPQ